MLLFMMIGVVQIIYGNYCNGDRMKKILTFGVFDYFHIGHLRLFKQCRQYADYLIVAVQDGDFILKFKPEAKVLYSTDERMEMIRALKIVDEVITYDILNAETMEQIDFDIWARGEDHVGGRFDEIEAWCLKNGKEVVTLRRTPGISSTEVKNLGICNEQISEKESGQ